MKTDEQVQVDVRSELQWEPSIEAAKFAVEVKEGVVTLTGHASSVLEKQDVWRVAQRVSGVRSVEVNIDVVPPEGLHGDADVARDKPGAAV